MLENNKLIKREIISWLGMMKYKTIEELRSAYVSRKITQREFIEKSSEMSMIRVPFNRLKKNNNHYQKKYSGKF